MVVADALSQCTDHSQGLEVDNDDVTALPEDLWIKLLDTELRDAVAKAQLGDKYAQEVLLSLNNPKQSLVKWTTEAYPNGTLALFYDGRIYIPDDLELRRQIVADHHDTSLAGHLGILATTRSVRTSYYWPGRTSAFHKELRQWLRHLPTLQKEHEAHEACTSSHS
jgi:hypothetical protein